MPVFLVNSRCWVQDYVSRKIECTPIPTGPEGGVETQKVSWYDQEIPQSHTADQGNATEHIQQQDIPKKIKAR